MISIGQKIYIERLRKELTQKELAKRSGIAQANISNFEKGRRDVTVTTLFRLCLALDVSLAKIFEKETAPKETAFTRQRVERIARAIVDENISVPKEDKQIVDLMKPIIPNERKSLFSLKKTYCAWHEIRRRLTDREINIILERVNDQKQRTHA